MKGMASDVFAGDAVNGARNGGGRETGVTEASASHDAPPAGSADPAGAATTDLRWLGMISCMGSAVIMLVGVALITGQLFLSGDGNMVAEDEGTLPDYAVAAGSD